MTDYPEREDAPQGQEVARTRDGARAETLKKTRDNLLADVEAHRGDITQILQATGGDFETFVAGLKIFLMRTMQDNASFFEDLTAVSFMEALMRCARDGLVPDGKEAAISAFKDRRTNRRRATYMPMRDGFVKVLWRTGQVVSINDNVVTKGEDEAGRFEYEEGDEGFIRHRPLLSRKNTDPVVAAYCVIKLKGGGTIREVVMADDLAQIRKMSQGDARKAWPHQMDRKAAIRRIMGKMPREKQIVQLLQHDEDNYDLAYAIPAPQHSGVRARLRPPNPDEVMPGFAPGHAEAQTNPLAPEALSQKLDEVLDGDVIPTGEEAAPEKPQAREMPIEPTVEDRVGDFLAGEAETPPVQTPFDWGTETRKKVANARSLAELNAATYGDFATRIEELRAESPGAAKALEATINGKRKALEDKERRR